MDYIKVELGLMDPFDFKLMVVENEKSKTLRPLEEDELLCNIFQKPSLLDKFTKDKNEIFLRKYIYLDFNLEEEQL